MQLFGKLAAACAALFVSMTVSAATIQFSAALSGPAEGNTSPGLGSALVTIDDVARTMNINASFSGLTGNTTAAHIHCCTTTPGAGTIGVATTTPNFPGFPTGVTAGSYNQTFDLNLASSYNASFVNANGGVPGAYNALLAGLNQGRAYFNIHSSTFGGGEIRGFLAPVPVPAAAWLFVSGIAGLATLRRKKVN